MAESPAHRFGQVIGELIEAVVLPQLQGFCDKQGLYLDYQKRKRVARSGKKVTWVDQYENAHDLDYVIERDGTDKKIGRPVAFIEVAWRRYTKHSRNKAQEIQGAILPLAERYKWNNPFLGTILAGVFTAASIDQLQSFGFNVLYFPYETLVASFRQEKIDISFDEDTPDNVFRNTVDTIQNTPTNKMKRVQQNLIKLNSIAIANFFSALTTRLGRHITKITLMPLYGRINEFSDIESAIKFLNTFRVYEGSGEFRKYEIHVDFSNGDKVEASLADKIKVKEFLEFVQKQ